MVKVITFYSYKGGTGRSMALANVALVLASNQRRVLVIDWDLEAPGLHYYFRPFLPDPDLAGYGVQGVIDIVLDYAAAAATPPPASKDAQPSAVWWQNYANFGERAIRLRWPSGEPMRFGERGTIDFVPAGRQDGEQYASHVNSFDWKHFYRDLNGGGFFNSVKASFSSYDYVLIDSRTGVSDTSGICTIQLPDTLVLCFTLNNQSIIGAAAAGASIMAQRPSMPIFPVPMRVDPFEKDRLNRRREYAHDIFGKFVRKLGGEAGSQMLEDYWKIELPYFPSYAYEETLSPFEQFSNNIGSLLPAVERLTQVISNGDVKGLESVPELKHERVEVQAEYAELPRIDPVRDVSHGSERQRISRKWVWVACLAWVFSAAFIFWVTYLNIGGHIEQERLGSRLVLYAGNHKDQIEDAASALVAARGLPVPPQAREIALGLAQTGVPVASLRGRFYAAALSPDNRSIAVTSSSKNLSLHVIGKKDAVWSASLEDPLLNEVEFSGDGSKIVTLGYAAEVWDAASGTKIWNSTYDPNGPTVQSGFTPDARYWNFLVRGMMRSFVAEYLRTAGESPAIKPSKFPDAKFPLATQLMRKVLSADGTLVAMTDRRTVSVWRLPTGELAIPSQSLPQNPPVIDYVFNASVTKMLIASATSARVWDLATNQIYGEKHFGEPPALMVLSPRGDVAAMSFRDGTIVLYQGPNLSHSRRFKIANHAPNIKFSTDGTLVYTQSSFGGNLTNAGDHISGVYVWPVDALDLSAGSTWPQLTQSLQAFGNCLTPAVRQEIFAEKAEVAPDNYNRCKSSE